MKRTWLYGLLIILGLLIAYLILGDIFSKDQNTKNPYQYDLTGVNAIDPAWIRYREAKRIATRVHGPAAIAYHNGQLGIAYEGHVQVIDTAGSEHFLLAVQGPSTCIAFDPDGRIFLGIKDKVRIFDPDGSLAAHWELPDSSAYLTSIAFNEDRVFMADAGNHVVHIYNYEGERLHSFDGKVPGHNDYGFIIPSPYFDVAVDSEDQLWVANTGLQSVENFTSEGVFRSYWGEPSFSVEGFIGCCNPAHFCIRSDGSFITCEKGSVRIKVYTPAGELESVVATPGDFDPDSEPPDITVDEDGNVYALDITRGMIRKFERKE